MKTFNSLPDLVSAIPDETAARAYMEEIIWGGTPICPHCYNQGGYKLKNGKTYKCKNKTCQRTFTVTVGTVFEKTHIKLTKWVYAIYLCTVHKRGISSYQLASDLGITQKTAWFMLHRIRKLFLDKAHDILTGEVEIDETFVGGKNKNRHFDKRVKKCEGRSYIDKTPVIGMMERGGKVVAFVIPNTQRATLERAVSKHIHPTAVIFTDEWSGYNDLYCRYEHHKVYHSRGEYSTEGVTTNRIENFWSHLKRGIIGIYYQITRKHLQRYIDEFTYRFNVRGMKNGMKLNTAIVNCRSRLKYKDLISSQQIYYG